MARGNYIGKSSAELPAEVRANIPARATRGLQEIDPKAAISEHPLRRQMLSSSRSPLPTNFIVPIKLLQLPQYRYVLLWTMSFVCAVLFLAVLLSAAINLRPRGPAILSLGGSASYSIQVGGDLAGTWEQDHPLTPKNPLLSQAGPYSVVGRPSVSVQFINEVLAAYHSSAAGEGQVLYNLGVQYSIDPVFALAFFMHESSFGTQGEAVNSLSLGNLRCIPNYRCQNNFAWFNTWEDGFEAWYELIRNLYVAQWGLVTVDQIIPRYAPESDHNNEAGYIAALKHAIDTWRANVIVVS
jgi:hypothetical protein